MKFLFSASHSHLYGELEICQGTWKSAAIFSRTPVSTIFKNVNVCVFWPSGVLLPSVVWPSGHKGIPEAKHQRITDTRERPTIAPQEKVGRLTQQMAVVHKASSRLSELEEPLGSVCCHLRWSRPRTEKFPYLASHD